MCIMTSKSNGKDDKSEMHQWYKIRPDRRSGQADSDNAESVSKISKTGI